MVKIIAGMALLKGTAVRAASALKKVVDKFNEFGEELVDGRSMEPPLGFEPSESLHEMINRAVRDRAVQQAIADAGGETFDEAEDFDVGDDLDPMSPYEAYFEPISEKEFDRLIQAGYEFREPAPPPKPSTPPLAASQAPPPPAAAPAASASAAAPLPQ